MKYLTFKNTLPLIILLIFYFEPALANNPFADQTEKIESWVKDLKVWVGVIMTAIIIVSVVLTSLQVLDRKYLIHIVLTTIGAGVVIVLVKMILDSL